MNAPRTAAPRHDFAVVSSEDIYTGKVMAIRRDDVRMPGGGTSIREIMEHPGAVAVAALDDDDRLMLIYQYRQAVRRRLWEMPAGLLDHAGEDPLVTARRELVEEVGLEATEWSVLIDVVSSPGFSEEAVRVYLATGLRDVGRPQLDADDEEADLETHWVPLADALAMAFDGTIVNSSCLAAVLAVHAVRTGAAQTRPVDAPWPDRPTRFAERKASR